MGSSPRVRGKLSRAFGQIVPQRLIPACAGKTFLGEAFEEEFGAHPRVCGENLSAWTTQKLPNGSSPRVRGKHEPLHHVMSRGLAHPRVCGENRLPFKKKIRIEGSSPRVRGKHLNTRANDARDRLIPACAGKTRRSSTTSPGGSAHPRVCGENIQARAKRGDKQGSSPRVRGKQTTNGGGTSRSRLIPACAGKT